MPRWPQADVLHLRFPSKVLGHNLALEADRCRAPLLAAAPPSPAGAWGFLHLRRVGVWDTLGEFPKEEEGQPLGAADRQDAW